MSWTYSAGEGEVGQGRFALLGLVVVEVVAMGWDLDWAEEVVEQVVRLLPVVEARLLPGRLLVTCLEWSHLQLLPQERMEPRS